jgi:hypothetical protein
MNVWEYEKTAEYNRQQAIEVIEQLRWERIRARARGDRPRLFARTMFNFANWMIVTGKQLRKRYEVPAVNCSKTESFAH